MKVMLVHFAIIDKNSTINEHNDHVEAGAGPLYTAQRTKKLAEHYVENWRRNHDASRQITSSRIAANSFAAAANGGVDP